MFKDKISLKTEFYKRKTLKMNIIKPFRKNLTQDSVGVFLKLVFHIIL